MTIALILSLIHLIISYGTYSVFFNNFVITLLKKKRKKWYSFVILGVAIATILTAALAIAMIPVVSKIASETRNASSGSSSALSASLALLYL